MVPVIRINAEGRDLRLPDGTRGRLAALPRDVPLVVLIHGYKYTPGVPRRDPHRQLLAPEGPTGAGRAVSWPSSLGLRHGLVVGFGWDAGGTIWRAQARAAEAGLALADLIAAAGRPVDLVAHSLGARVALSALGSLPAGAVSRAILISGAELRSAARVALASPAGATAEVVNVCSRENDLFDALYEAFVAPHRPFDRAIGSGLGQPSPNWLDLQLDGERVRSGLAGLGFPIPAPERRICHWSGYLRPGTWALYRALIEHRLPLDTLRRALPDGVEPRWSRLFDGLTPRRDLSAVRSAPS